MAIIITIVMRRQQPLERADFKTQNIVIFQYSESYFMKEILL